MLINLLIRDLRTLDGIETVARKKGIELSGKNVDAYVDFLNNQCKVRFRWYIEKESKSITWRDLTGPEKIRLFSNIDIPVLFPDLETRVQLQEIWKEFFDLTKELGKSECCPTDFDRRSKDWHLLQSIKQRMSHPICMLFPCTFPNF